MANSSPQQEIEGLNLQQERRLEFGTDFKKTMIMYTISWREKATSFWGEGDIVVKELSELHRHVSETLRGQLCGSSRCVHRI